MKVSFDWIMKIVIDLIEQFFIIVYYNQKCGDNIWKGDGNLEDLCI